MTDLAVLYEHPAWFKALFGALGARGLDWRPIAIQDHTFDPAGKPPARVIFNRLAMSSLNRQVEHGLFHCLAAFDHWEGEGARVINGAWPLAYDLNKARQLSLFHRAGLDIPTTRVAHRREDIPRLAAEVGYPVMVKANVGGSGAGMIRYDDPDELATAAADALTPMGVDGVVLVQEYVPAREGRVIRCEVLAGRFLYAIALTGAGSTFDLCPADVCLAEKPTITVEAFHPPAGIIEAVLRVAAMTGLDIGGIEYLIDDRDSQPKFYDFNAMSNFVANPFDVLGFDPHDKLVDFIAHEIAQAKALA
ncbi:MAG: ATP-grasp domain-containing protein [Caulobacteraceae bacterium]